MKMFGHIKGGDYSKQTVTPLGHRSRTGTGAIFVIRGKDEHGLQLEVRGFHQPTVIFTEKLGRRLQEQVIGRDPVMGRELHVSPRTWEDLGPFERFHAYRDNSVEHFRQVTWLRGHDWIRHPERAASPEDFPASVTPLLPVTSIERETRRLLRLLADGLRIPGAVAFKNGFEVMMSGADEDERIFREGREAQQAAMRRASSE